MSLQDLISRIFWTFLDFSWECRPWTSRVAPEQGRKPPPNRKKIKLVELMKQSHGNRKRHSQVQFQEPKKRPGAMFILAVRISLG